MNEQQTKAYDIIMNAMLALPWAERGDVFAHVRFNDIFCVNCGDGERNNPNRNCQCDNDE